MEQGGIWLIKMTLPPETGGRVSYAKLDLAIIRLGNANCFVSVQEGGGTAPDRELSKENSAQRIRSLFVLSEKTPIDECVSSHPGSGAQRHWWFSPEATWTSP